ncbi:MAG: hypothetical protein R6U78_13515, partial [Bacteroidales bacterium]
ARDLPHDEPISFFLTQGEHYKPAIISDIPAHETLSLYRQGDFIDLCRGPHVPSTGKLGAFKLTKLAGRPSTDTAWTRASRSRAYRIQPPWTPPTGRPTR